MTTRLWLAASLCLFAGSAVAQECTVGDANHSSTSYAQECHAWIQGDLSHIPDSNYATTRYAEELRLMKILDDDEASLEACLEIVLDWLLSDRPEIDKQTSRTFSRQDGDVTLFFAQEREPAQRNPLDRQIKVEFDDCTYHISKFDGIRGRAEGGEDCDSFDFTFGSDPRFHSGGELSNAVK